MAATVPKSRLPTTLKPMLARLVRHPFDSPDHLFELKWDGVRSLAFIEDGHLRLLSRSGRDITAHVPEVSAIPRQVKADRVVLDGELVCLDDRGHPSYERLQQRFATPEGRRSRKNPAHFIAFDLLYLDGKPLLPESLVHRKNLLHETLKPNEVVQASDFVEGSGIAFFEATCQLGLEGIVAKEKGSPYLPGKRSAAWLKVKRLREAEFVIGGYTFGGTRREFFSSLLLGLHDGAGRLVYVGQVSTGVSKKTAKELATSLGRLHVDTQPFVSVPRIPKFIFWCRPELVCQVEYGEFTEDGRLAYPIFKALREDKSPEDCVIADAAGWPGQLITLE